MKKHILLTFLLIICVCLTIPAAAEDGFVDAYYRVVDTAGLLTENELNTLIERLDEISIRQSMDVTVVTLDELEGQTPQEYADYAYEYLQYGYGDSKDGVLLLISIAEGDWYISTCGYGIEAFTDYGIDYIGEQITPDLSRGYYATAFTKYAQLCDEFISQARAGEPFDRGNRADEPLSAIWILISIVIGFILANVIVGGMKGKLKTVRAQAAANSYVKSGSMNVTESRDLFLYHTVTRSAKSNNNGSSSGSSTHRSASGTTHGGGGGKF